MGDLFMDKGYIFTADNSVPDTFAQEISKNANLKALVAKNKNLTGDTFIRLFLKDELTLNTDLLDELSKMPRENRIPAGQIEVTKPNDYADSSILFSVPITFSLENKRIIHRFLEMCTDQTALLVEMKDGLKVVGIGKTYEPVCRIAFEGSLKWSIEYIGRIYKRIEGKYHVAVKEPKTDRFIKAMESVFKCKYDYTAKNRLSNIYEGIVTQPHGAMIVFLENAAEEAKRLISANRGTGIKNKAIRDSNMFYGLTAVDGAVLFDMEGNCQGFGFMLDGEAIVKNRTDRGERYNTAYNYTACKNKAGKKCMTVTVSEDKLVDFIDSDQKNITFDLIDSAKDKTASLVKS